MYIDALSPYPISKFEHTPLLQRILLFSTALCKLPSFHVIIFRFSRLIDPESVAIIYKGEDVFLNNLIQKHIKLMISS